ncbi:MAG: HAMP domain-containing histidine kinase [Planctomycetes bacterium]|nr:HAMP domain-containing histidine kinase [Planctomycetota bacterium]
MKLRAKILSVIAAMMALLYLLVAAALIPELVQNRVNARMEVGQLIANRMAALVEQIPRSERRARVRSGEDLVSMSPEPSFWAITDGRGKLVGWSRKEAPPADFDPEENTGMPMVRRPLSPVDADESPWQLYLAPAAELGLARELWSVFIAMLVGTAVLGLAIYGLLLRLVIKPVERLALNSRLAAGGRGALPTVPHTDRTDEVGDLIRSYNGMVGEVNELRLQMEKRVAEALRQKEDAQKKLLLSERLSVTGRLAAGVAHEINNPLGGMLNATRSLLQKAEPGTRDAEYLGLIEDGLKRVQTILSSMLQFARPVPQHSSVNVAEVFEGALLFCKHRMEKEKIELARDFAAGTSAAIVYGNRTELGQVVLNLMVNAIDAMEGRPEGQRRLSLGARREGENVLVTVGDTGAGMAQEVRDQAGEIFFSTKAAGRGTGLGLAIVKYIVSEHGGSVAIESEVARGTTVRVVLPAEKQEPVRS